MTENLKTGTYWSWVWKFSVISDEDQLKHLLLKGFSTPFLLKIQAAVQVSLLTDEQVLQPPD